MERHRASATPVTSVTDSASDSVDVCFIAVKQRWQADAAAPVIRNLEATSRRPVSTRYHIVVDERRAPLRARMKAHANWRGVPVARTWLHSTLRIAAEARSLYTRLIRTATGPGPLYLWKPLLHLVLPSWLGRVVVLDFDLFFFSDVGRLWRQFDAFPSRALIGLAEEQCPSYQEVRAMGGVSFNGGVQLLHLARMRASVPYAGAHGIDRRAAAVPPPCHRRVSPPLPPPCATAA